MPKRLLRALRHGDLLIDAHNLCFRDPALASLMAADPETARQTLERRLRHLRRAILFYDGGPAGERRTISRLGLRCVYSGGDGNSDDEIVSWLIRHRPDHPVVVVSDDRELRQRVMAHGALPCHCSQFLAWAGPPPPRPATSGSDSAPDPVEVDFWLRQFGVDDGKQSRE